MVFYNTFMYIDHLEGKNLLLKCDNCHNTFKRYDKHNDFKKLTHWCSKSCLSVANKKGGIIRQKSEKTSLEKYGVLNSSQSEIVEQKRRKTCSERFGKGITSPMQIKEFKELRKINTQNKYGVDNVAKLPQTIQKMHETNLLKYGAKSPLKNQEVYKRVDWDTAVRNNHLSKKRNNSFRKSYPEDQVYEICCDFFGKENVERQVMMNKKWPIDLHIKTLNVYVQYDSYWHGYEDKKLRNLDEVKEFKTKQDCSIYKKMLGDIVQNEWFSQQKLKFVRIIGDEFKNKEFVINKIVSTESPAELDTR